MPWRDRRKESRVSKQLGRCCPTVRERSSSSLVLAQQSFAITSHGYDEQHGGVSDTGAAQSANNFTISLQLGPWNSVPLVLQLEPVGIMIIFFAIQLVCVALNKVILSNTTIWGCYTVYC